VLTDWGGIQEEGPAPVMRREPERPEAVEAGTLKLVGPSAGRIVQETEILPHDPAAYDRMARAVSPYGEGQAAERIVRIILGLEGRSS